ncbi:hypothetical protein E2C01_018892 [Portunus trituberculatus]|uniref:Uncharacterized protein n=1 Tax=Portunus trituberculatus TaxID=210409 RepID=A0A5B7DVV7_PORTR|nr:hypothetical protein [Portunus trituberculatus]
MQCKQAQPDKKNPMGAWESPMSGQPCGRRKCKQTRKRRRADAPLCSLGR